MTPRLAFASASAAAPAVANALYGDGSDGDLILDGVSTVLGMVPVGGVYTAPRQINAHNITSTNGAILNANGWPILATGTADGCVIRNNGADAVGTNGGAGGGGNYLGGGGNGGNGGTVGATNGQTTNHQPLEFVAGHVFQGFLVAPGVDGGLGQGGSGGDSTGGGAGQGGDVNHTTSLSPTRNLITAYQGHGFNDASALGGGTGGGGGRSTSGTPGGGGGGGGWCVAALRTTKNVTIQANGGNAANGVGGDACGGGGGAGGVAVLITDSVSGYTVTATGGTKGVPTGGSTGLAGGAGGAGLTIIYDGSGA